MCYSEINFCIAYSLFVYVSAYPKTCSGGAISLGGHLGSPSGGFGSNASNRWRQEGLGAESPTLEDFAIFRKKKKNLRPILVTRSIEINTADA